MKKFRLIGKILNVRKTPSIGAAVTDTLRTGAEFWSDEQVPGTNNSQWASRLIETKDGPMVRSGWCCISDRSMRYLQEIPQPAKIAPVEEPSPVPDISDEQKSLEARVIILEAQVKHLLSLFPAF